MTTLMLKYRPKTFKEVIGQVPIVRSLKQLLAGGTNRTSLFSGPSGTGKTTLARIAAAEVGCLDQDITEIDGATFTGIDDMRQITSSLAYRPLGEGAVKAIIIDECHMLSPAVFKRSAASSLDLAAMHRPRLARACLGLPEALRAHRATILSQSLSSSPIPSASAIKASQSVRSLVETDLRP